MHIHIHRCPKRTSHTQNSNFLELFYPGNEKRTPKNVQQSRIEKLQGTRGVNTFASAYTLKDSGRNAVEQGPGNMDHPSRVDRTSPKGSYQVEHSAKGVLAVEETPRVSRYIGRTYNIAVTRNGRGVSQKAQKSFVFSILATFVMFASVRIYSRFFARYRGIRSAKQYKTLGQTRAILRVLGDLLGRDEWPPFFGELFTSPISRGRPQVR